MTCVLGAQTSQSFIAPFFIVIGFPLCLFSPLASAQNGDSAGQRIYIDPQTFERTTPPPAAPEPLFESSPSATTREAAQSATLETFVSAMTSDEGLEMEPSPIPGGGMKVNLQGRFRHPLVATIEPNGNIRIQHQGQHQGHPTQPTQQPDSREDP